MKLKYWNYPPRSEGFEADDSDGREIGGIQKTKEGRWCLMIAGESFHPSDCTTANDLRQIAMVIDYLNGEL